jgi:hypothetical protein
MRKLFFGMAALIVAAGLVLAGCENGTTSDINGENKMFFTVSFETGEGGGTPPSSWTVSSSTGINLPGQGNMTAPSSKTFNGWKIGDGIFSEGSNYVVMNDTVCVAQWKSSSEGGTSKPGTPTNVNAAATSSSSIVITWNAPSSGGTPTWYNILRATSASGTYTEIDYVSGSTFSYTNTGLSSSATYYYKIEAENSVGKGSQSSYAYATTLSSGGSTSYGSIKIVNNSSYTVGNITMYRSGYNLITFSGIETLLNNNISSGGTITVNNVTPGTYIEMGSATVSGYKMKKYTTFTITAGQTTTVTITNSDICSN